MPHRKHAAWLVLAAAGRATGLLVGMPPALRHRPAARAARMAALDELGRIRGPEILWGPEGAAAGKNESDVKGYEGFSRFVAACEQYGVVPPPNCTVLAPVDSAFERAERAGVALTADVLKYHIITGGAKSLDMLSTDQLTLQGGTLSAYRKLRKNYLDDALIGLAWASEAKGWPMDVRTTDGCMLHGIDTVLVPGAPARNASDAAPPPAATPLVAPPPPPPAAAKTPAGPPTVGVSGSALGAAAKAKKSASVAVQGGSLRTWTYQSPLVDEVQVELSTEGRPLDADIDLWHGPDNTPCKLRVYVENGKVRPFRAVIQTPRGPNTVALRNIGQLEFPFGASVTSDIEHRPTEECLTAGLTIQGGALRTFPFDATVDSVQVLLTTDGRPLNARVELLQGPNNIKQVVELYTEDGRERPFFCVIDTPGSGNVVRVVNTAPVEFPMNTAVVPLLINPDAGEEVVLGGDVVMGGW